MQELWKPIKDYEGLYEVSNLGRVKSLPKMHGNRYWNFSLILKENIAYNGYSGVFLQKNKKSTRKSLHRLVAESFIPNPNNLPQVNHKDGNKLNNRVDNLEWCSQSENQIHSRKLGLQKNLKGKDSPSSKKILQYDKFGNFIAEHICIKETAEKFGITSGTLSNCLRGKRKTAGGYVWRYKNAE